MNDTHFWLPYPAFHPYYIFSYTEKELNNYLKTCLQNQMQDKSGWGDGIEQNTRWPLCLEWRCYAGNCQTTFWLHGWEEQWMHGYCRANIHTSTILWSRGIEHGFIWIKHNRPHPLVVLVMRWLLAASMHIPHAHTAFIISRCQGCLVVRVEMDRAASK